MKTLKSPRVRSGQVASRSLRQLRTTSPRTVVTCKISTKPPSKAADQPAKASTFAQPVQLPTRSDPRRKGFWTTERMPPQDGKTFIVTGGSSGMGFECAASIAKKGGNVIIATPTMERAQGAAEKIKDAGVRGNAEGMQLDLASFRSIVDFANAFKERGLPLNVLVNNAGVFLVPFDRTEQGFEITVGINYLGHFLLTHLLLDKLKATAKQYDEARIVSMASLFELFGDVPWGDLGGSRATDSSLFEYGNSKLMVIMAGREMNKRLRGSGVEVFLSQPGLVQSPLTTRKLDHKKAIANVMELSARVYGHGPKPGSLCLQRPATDPDLRGYGGSYFTPPFLGPLALNLDTAGMREPSNGLSRDEVAWAHLYNQTLQLVNAKLKEEQLPQISKISQS